MISKLFFLWILLIFYINVSFEIRISNDSKLYDTLSKDTYKVGDEVVLFRYTNIKGDINDECINIYNSALYFSDNNPVSEIDYYFKTKDTIVAIIPDVPPGEEYFIAFNIDPQFQEYYLYTKRFDIVPGGKVKKMSTQKDACGIKRVSIYGEDIQSVSKKSKNKVSTNITSVITSTTIQATSTSQIIQNSNFNNNNNNPASSTINNKIEPPIDGLKQNLANEKKSAGNYIIAFIMGIAFCGIAVVGYIYVTKRGKKERGIQLPSIYSENNDNNSECFPSPKLKDDNIALTMPSDCGYQLNLNNNNVSDNNHSINTEVNVNNNNTNSIIQSNKFDINKDNNVVINSFPPFSTPTYRRLTIQSDASQVPSSNLFSSAASVSLQSYPVNAPSVNVLDPIETPSTEIKFVATSSYEPQNKNEIAISSLDIVYLVGYIDENYAQILNITTNNYGIIPINELNKIQP